MRQLPQTSRVKQAAWGEVATWGPQEHLLAVIADAVRGANWQRSGGKGAKPKPIPRPGSDRTMERRLGGTTVISIDEMRERLARRRARERAG